MTKRMRGLAGALGAVALITTLSSVQVASAESIFEQVEYGPLSIGGRATYYDPNDADGNWYGGAQVRAYLGKYFAIEGSADYRRNDFEDTKVHSYPVQVSALIYPLGHMRLAPFILGGGGWYYTSVEGPAVDDTQNRFGAHAGGGLQFMLTRHLSIDATYRYVWLESIQSKNASLDDKKFSDNGYMVTVGLNFHF